MGLSKLEQLEVNAFNQPNSIEINQALAEAYAKEERWEEAIEAYQSVISLYPTVTALNVNRIRLGAIALGTSSIFFFISQLLDPTRFAFEPYDFITSPALAISNVLLLPILILLSCAAISIYKLLSTSSDNKLAFWSMVFVITGAELFLPFFGIKAIVLPMAGMSYLQGDAIALSLYDSILRQPLAVIFTLGAYLLVVGLTMFNVAVWGSGYLPKWASTVLWLGWSLFILTEGLPFNFAADILQISSPLLFALLVVIGGIGLAQAVWRQASIQLQHTHGLHSH